MVIIIGGEILGESSKLLNLPIKKPCNGDITIYQCFQPKKLAKSIGTSWIQ